MAFITSILDSTGWFRNDSKADYGNFPPAYTLDPLSSIRGYG